MTTLEQALRSEPMRALPTQVADAFADAAERAELVDVAYAMVAAPWGELTVAATPKGLARVGFGDIAAVLTELSARLSPRILHAPALLDVVRRQLDDYFAGRRHGFELPLDWSLVTSTFRRRVLEAAAAIPYAATSSYAAIAAAAGNARAVRAAGSALGANPLCIVVPCHRVLRNGGGLGGYAGGLPVKETLLALESANASG